MEGIPSPWKVEYNSPNVVTVFKLDNPDKDTTTIIQYSKFRKFKESQNKEDLKRKEKFHNKISKLSSLAELDASPSFMSTKSSNIYANVVSKLEKQAAVGFFNSEDEDEEEEEEEEKLEDHKKKSKKRLTSGMYDLEDPFVDDSELIEEIDASYKSKRTKPSLDGFFVNSGKLATVSKKRTLTPAPILSAPLASSVPPTSIESNDVLDINEKKSKDKKKDNDNELEEVKFLEENKDKKDKKKKKKWLPNEETNECMKRISEKILEIKSHASTPSSATSNKQIPSEFHAVLLELDEFVSQYYSATHLRDHAGYYEWIQEKVGKNLSVTKISNQLLKIRRLKDIEKERVLLDEHIKNFTKIVKDAIRDCPENKKQVIITKKTKPTKNAQEATLSAEVGGNQEEKKEEEKSNQEIIDNSSSESKEGEEVKEIITYKYILNWTSEMRKLIYDINDKFLKVCEVNNHIADLYPEDMKELNITRLEPRKEQGILFEKISKDTFPPSCLNGDIEGIRKALKAERAKIKRSLTTTSVSSQAPNTTTAPSSPPPAPSKISPSSPPPISVPPSI